MNNPSTIPLTRPSHDPLLEGPLWCTESAALLVDADDGRDRLGVRPCPGDSGMAAGDSDRGSRRPERLAPRGGPPRRLFDHASSLRVEIRSITLVDELEAVARLRYEIYVEELGYAQPLADPKCRTIHEPLDSEGLLLGAFAADGRLLGSIRIAPSDAPGISTPEIYGWEERQRSAPQQVFHASKLLVARAERGSRVGFELVAAAASAAVRRGWRYAFLECYPHLIPLYERLGFQVRAQTFDPTFGEVTIMELDLGDLEHLRRIRSPLLPVLLGQGFPEPEVLVA